MRLCVFEDGGVELLEPLCLTRPAWDLRGGGGTLLERFRRRIAAREVGVIVRPDLAEISRLLHPDFPVNDAAWLRSREPTLYVNARWLIDTPPEQWAGVGLANNQVAYVAEAQLRPPEESGPALEDWLEECRRQGPTRSAPGRMMDFLWDLVDANSDLLRDDAAWFRLGHDLSRSHAIAVLGPAENLLVAEGVEVEAYVAADTRGGPITIEPGAVLHAFTRLEGPCHIGAETILLGTKLRAGTTLGPCCRIGGEVEAAIVQGHANKYHDGFLGHAYIGEWVNLAAGTQTSDLRNDYGPVRTTVAGRRVNTGRTKVGCFIGDHTKTGLGALFNTGSVVGAFCNVLPDGRLLPQVIPSFSLVQDGHLQERWDFRQLFATAAVVMNRRGRELTEVHRELYYGVYESTTDFRRRTLHENEMRRLRRSV